MYVNFLSICILTKSPAIPQQLYKPAARGLSAIAELLVLPRDAMQARSLLSSSVRPSVCPSVWTFSTMCRNTPLDKNDLNCTILHVI